MHLCETLRPLSQGEDVSLSSATGSKEFTFSGEEKFLKDALQDSIHKSQRKNLTFSFLHPPKAKGSKRSLNSLPTDSREAATELPYQHFKFSPGSSRGAPQTTKKKSK
ncbi:hypothetical protein TNCT_726141 [Trichonephila clavata]|uniref:Uncharacterized protein n=1 Tax=Trichonephila clavata TaxID=2740835 RepID=A0A8X6M0J5_TRICU|nr:hypothetical protein TNCT_726141 [Trichonephila clavata]